VTYLDRLRALKAKNHAQEQVAKVSKAPFDTFDTCQVTSIFEILAPPGPPPEAPSAATAGKAPWKPVAELPDLRRVQLLALDTETCDRGLQAGIGAGWSWKGGHLCGVSVAYRRESEICAHYFPIRHPDGDNFDSERVFDWVRDHAASDVRILTQNGLYDWGWLYADAGIQMPASDRLEEIGALATIVDENRHGYQPYSLDALCAWRGIPGKDEGLLKAGAQETEAPRINPQAAGTLCWSVRRAGRYRYVGAVRKSLSHACRREHAFSLSPRN
jgi:hypothetical protein